MDDGSVYAGISPDTGKLMFVIPEIEGAEGVMAWRPANKFSENLDLCGHTDWQLPTIDELNVMFANSADIGGFKEEGSLVRTTYWSRTSGCENGNTSFMLRKHFGDVSLREELKAGSIESSNITAYSNIRCVRYE